MDYDSSENLCTMHILIRQILSIQAASSMRHLVWKRCSQTAIACVFTPESIQLHLHIADAVTVEEYMKIQLLEHTHEYSIPCRGTDKVVLRDIASCTNNSAESMYTLQFCGLLQLRPTDQGFIYVHVH